MLGGFLRDTRVVCLIPIELLLTFRGCLAQAHTRASID
jgi:hypothetical protein